MGNGVEDLKLSAPPNLMWEFLFYFHFERAGLTIMKKSNENTVRCIFDGNAQTELNRLSNIWGGVAHIQLAAVMMRLKNLHLTLSGSRSKATDNKALEG